MRLVFIISFLPVLAFADMPIPANYLVPNWRAVVGIPGGVPRYPVGTNIVGIDGSGATDVSGVLNAIMLSKKATYTACVLGAGTFTLSNTITPQAGMVLRGSGTNTILHFYTNTISGGYSYLSLESSPGGGIITHNLSSDASRGDASVVLVAAPGNEITAGCMMLVNELNDNTFVTANGWEDQCGPHICTYCDQRNNGTRIRGQFVLITNVAGAVVSFTPPLFSAFKIANTARVEYYQWPQVGTNNTQAWTGVEDLTIDNSNNSVDRSLIQIGGNGAASFCWVSNVNFHISGVSESPGIETSECMNYEVRHCYAVGHGNNGRAWLFYSYVDSGNGLFEDNIGVSLTVFWAQAGLNCGNVCFGNLNIIHTTVAGPVDGSGFNNNDFDYHGGHVDFTLVEANFASRFNLESIHGSSSRSAIFRNWWRERNTNTSTAAYAIQIDQTNYYTSAVGNILGYSGMATNDIGIGWVYKYTSDGSGSGHSDCVAYGPVNAMHDFVYSMCGNNQHTVDPNVEATGLRDMNFSWVSNAVEHAQGGAINLNKSILYPSSTTGFWTSSPGTGVPIYWGNLTWPAFEPTLAGNYTVFPQATNSLPSALRYWTGVDPSQGGGGGGGNSQVFSVDAIINQANLSGALIQ